jgi:hypothetical protein
MKKTKMENYKIKVQITSFSDDVIGEFEVTTKEYEIIKETTGKDLISQGVDLVLNDVKEIRRSNPHHHTNRVD